MIENDLRVITVSTDSVRVRWSKIDNVPDGLESYFTYRLMYKLDSASQYTEGELTAHDEPAPEIGFLEAEVTGLEENKLYELKVEAYRVVRGMWEKTAETLSVSVRTVNGKDGFNSRKGEFIFTHVSLHHFFNTWHIHRLVCCSITSRTGCGIRLSWGW